MRRITKAVNCGDVIIGGGAPVSIQSMTNTLTADVKSTVAQIHELEDVGCQIVRCAVPDMESAEALKEIKRRISIPLVADIHFDYRLAIAAIKNGADKIRINPGNIGSRDRIEAVAKAASEYEIPIRVGVNSGSLEKDLIKKYHGVTADGIVESAVNNIKMLEDVNFKNIIVSIKSSDVVMNYEAHKKFAAIGDYPIHVGLTESGTSQGGIIKSAVGIGALLLEGIGDTIRVSLTGSPVREISAARDILSSAGLDDTRINLIVCPTCGRTKVDLERIAAEAEERIRNLEADERRASVKARKMTVAVMGCAVNGPGEASNADIGIACGDGMGLLFMNGNIISTLREDEIVDKLIEAVARERSDGFAGRSIG